MKILLDTNIFISTILFPNSVAARAFNKAKRSPFTPVITSYIVKEILLVIQDEFPEVSEYAENFIDIALTPFELVDTPDTVSSFEELILDVKDRPIIRAALANKVDILVSRDKHFLNVKIPGIRMMSPLDFLDYTFY